MIKSIFLKHVLDLLIDGEDSRYIAPQLDYIEEEIIEYTGMGVFIYFSHSQDVKDYLLRDTGVHLDGVTIESPELEEKALAVLHFNDGIIDNLEIWSPSGHYIKKEPSNYTVRQEFTAGRNRIITV